MPRERLTIVPSFKVKRLARLFEDSRSPKKVMTSKKDKNGRKEKLNKIRNAMADELSSDGEVVVSQVPAVQQPGTRQEPVVPQPIGTQEQVVQTGEGVSGANKAGTGTGVGAGGSAEIMRNFLNRGEETSRNVSGTSSTKRGREEAGQKEPPPKRQEGEGTDSEASVMEVEERAAAAKKTGTPVEEEIRRIMERCKSGEVSLDEACHGMVSCINRRLEEQLNKVKKAAAAVFQEQRETEKAVRSVVVFNADRWQIPEQGDGLGVQPLADRITGAIHRMTGHMVSVMEAIPMGPRREGREPAMVRVVLGSARQKSTLFRCLAAHVRNGTRIGQELAKVSMRDYFPREKVNDAKVLIQRGAVLKRNGKIGSYRVVAKGDACIPVLEVKYHVGGGQKGPWIVFQSQMAQGTGERRRSRSTRRENRRSRSPREESRSGERRQRRGEKEKGSYRRFSGPPVWELDMDDIVKLPWDQASAMMEKEKERLRVETEAWKAQRDEELEWNTYVEQY